MRSTRIVRCSALSLDDPAAFGVLFEEHFTDIFRYLERRVGPEPAKEARGGRICRRVREAVQLRPEPRRGSVLAVRHSDESLANHRKEEVTELRRRPRASVANDEIEPDTEAATERLFASSQRSRLLAGLAQLDDRSRDVICLTAFVDLTSAEIARGSASRRVPSGAAFGAPVDGCNRRFGHETAQFQRCHLVAILSVGATS